jgi:hypothetical protein
MPVYAPAALAAAVALSALGAVTLCALVMLYGFTPAGEEPPGETSRRMLFTRIGHALAAVCFAATAILIVLVLARPTPIPAAPPVAGQDTRVPALGARVAGQETRLSETETRMQRLEHAMNERAAAPPAVAEDTRVPALGARMTGQEVRMSEAEARMRKLERAIQERAAVAAAPTPPGVRARSALPIAAALPAPPPVAPSPVPPPVAVSPVLAPSAIASPPPPPAASAPPARSAPPPRFDLRNKLREDWREIRRGADSAGDDFRRAVDGVKRNFGVGD